MKNKNKQSLSIQVYVLISCLTLCLFIFQATLDAKQQSDDYKIIHIFVALADNTHQGIVPVKSSLGNGDNPRTNLYWGAMYGVRSFFKRSGYWVFMGKYNTTNENILERIVLRHKSGNALIIADAYRGRNIKECTREFLRAAAGKRAEIIKLKDGKGNTSEININSNGALICYVGHNGLLDFRLTNYPTGKKTNRRKVIILGCWSRQLFRDAVKKSRAHPLLWATGKLAPEAYILEAAFSNYVKNADSNEIRRSAARAYNKYQKCGLKAAKRLLVTGF